MNPANLIFYILLFVGFFLPTNSEMYIPLPGVLLKFSELAFITLPIVNLLCSSAYEKVVLDKRLYNIILSYLLFVFFIEFSIKPIFYDQPIADSFRSFRLGLPLYSSLIILLMGIKADIKIVWKVLLYTIGTSIILSVLSIFISLPIYYNIGNENILELFNGRVINSNASFGIIGLYLLFSDKDKWYNQGYLVKAVSLLSVLSLIITFNRTYLALLLMGFVIITIKNFSIKNIYKIVLYPTLLFIVLFFVYNNFNTVKNQIDKRILSLVFKEEVFIKSTISSSRNNIYDGVSNRMRQDYWIIGLPYDVEIFSQYMPVQGEYHATKTDISFVNILLRYGIVSLIIFLCFLYRLQRTTKFPLIILLSYILASLNTDSLFNQNSILFLILFSIIYMSKEFVLKDSNSKIQSHE